MATRAIAPSVYAVGAVDWDRRLFDAFIPLPDGTSYNSYLVRGSEKIALIDAVDPTMQQVLLNNLKELGVERIDYVVVNHAEQDHSGSLPPILERYPSAQVMVTPRGKGLLSDLLMIPAERVITVNDGETISLGDKTLEFVHASWVHWPETMTTYLREDRILFSCDFFGAHLATTDLYVRDEGQVYEAAKRYFAEIMMPFTTQIRKNLERIGGYPIGVIAPGHGPLYDRPEFIIEAYRRWVHDEPRNIVVLPYISMHNSTRRMVEYLVGALSRRGVTVKQFDLTATDMGKLATALVDAATIVIGTPTVLAGPHPSAVYAAFLTNTLKPRLRFASVIGSYGWGGKTVEQVTAMLAPLRLEMLEGVLCKGVPKELDFRALDNLASTIAEKHRENGFH